MAEQMLSMTREDPLAYQIRDHKAEVRKQMAIEATTKLHALQKQLIRIETKRVKDVKDKLLVNELTQKI